MRTQKNRAQAVVRLLQFPASNPGRFCFSDVCKNTVRRHSAQMAVAASVKHPAFNVSAPIDSHRPCHDFQCLAEHVGTASRSFGNGGVCSASLGFSVPVCRQTFAYARVT